MSEGKYTKESTDTIVDTDLVRNELVLKESQAERSARLALYCFGGQAARVADRACRLNFPNIDITVMNTDKKDNSMIREKYSDSRVKIIDVGHKDYIICGSGAGGNTTVAERGFAEVQDQVRNQLEQQRNNMVQVIFVSIGLGGGTGTGFIVPFLKLCREQKFKSVIVLATMPSLRKEGRNTAERARAKLAEIQTLCDGIMILKTVKPAATKKLSLQEMNDRINNRITEVLASFFEIIISNVSEKNIDLNDLISCINSKASDSEQGENLPKPQGRAETDSQIANLFILGRGLYKEEDNEGDKPKDKQSDEPYNDRIIKALKKSLDADFLMRNGSVKGANSFLYHVIMPQGEPFYDEENYVLLDYALEATGTNLDQRMQGFGEAQYTSPLKLEKGSLLLITLFSDFDITPLEAFDADLKEEGLQKRHSAKQKVEEKPVKRTVIVEDPEDVLPVELNSPILQAPVQGPVRVSPAKGSYEEEKAEDPKEEGLFKKDVRASAKPLETSSTSKPAESQTPKVDKVVENKSDKELDSLRERMADLYNNK